MSPSRKSRASSSFQNWGAAARAGGAAAVWEYDLPTDYSVSGTRVLTLTVER